MAAGNASTPQEMRVWDLPTRLFHWTLAALVIFSFTTGKVGGGWMEWHLKSGYAILALLLFRLVWGFAGSQTARFADFLRGPGAAIAYVRALRSPRKPFLAGHNPLGGWMVVAMLATLLVQASSGLFADDEIATQGPLAVKVSNAFVGRMSQWHSINSWVVVALVVLHVCAILSYWFGLRSNLVAPMVTGSRAVPEGAAISAPRLASSGWATIVLAVAAVLVYALVVIYPKS
jgi:cytochrome b